MSALLVLTYVLKAAMTATPDHEIRFWSAVMDVDPEVALAVADVESGDVPECWEKPSVYWRDCRDRIVSKGNYGRFQINAGFWVPRLPITKELLRNRHVNIVVGIWILRRFYRKYATPSGTCGCGGAHYWVSHYNEGTTVTEWGAAFGEKVRLKRNESRNPGFLVRAVRRLGHGNYRPAAR